MIRLIVSVASRVWSGGEHEVAGLGGGERRADRLLVAHLADQDHVGVLAQDAPHRAGEALGVRAPTSRWLMIERLSRCRYSIGSSSVTMWRAPGRVDVVDHRRERRRLARAGRAGEEDDPALLLGEVADHLGQAEVVDRAHLERDRAAGDRDVPRWRKALTRKRETPGDRVGEVGLAVLAELLEQVGSVLGDVVQRRLGVLRGQRLGVLERPSSPWTRAIGGEGTFRCRSEPSRSTTYAALRRCRKPSPCLSAWGRRPLRQPASPSGRSHERPPRA